MTSGRPIASPGCRHDQAVYEAVTVNVSTGQKDMLVLSGACRSPINLVPRKQQRHAATIIARQRHQSAPGGSQQVWRIADRDARIGRHGEHHHVAPGILDGCHNAEPEITTIPDDDRAEDSLSDRDLDVPKPLLGEACSKSEGFGARAFSLERFALHAHTGWARRHACMPKRLNRGRGSFSLFFGPLDAILRLCASPHHHIDPTARSGLRQRRGCHGAPYAGTRFVRNPVMRKHVTLGGHREFAEDFAMLRYQERSRERPFHVIRSQRTIRRDFDKDAPNGVIGMPMPNRSDRRDPHACCLVGIFRVAAADNRIVNFVRLIGQLVLQSSRRRVAYVLGQFGDAVDSPRSPLADEIIEQMHRRAVVRDLSKAGLARLGENLARRDFSVGFLGGRLEFVPRLKARAHLPMTLDETFERSF